MTNLLLHTPLTPRRSLVAHPRGALVEPRPLAAEADGVQDGPAVAVAVRPGVAVGACVAVKRDISNCNILFTRL